MVEPLSPDHDRAIQEAPPAAVRAAQTPTGRAFAGITLFGALLLILGPFVPWVQIYNSDDGWISIYVPWTANGSPSDAVWALCLGFAAVCVGGARMAITTPWGVRLAQALAGGYMAIGAGTDWSRALQNGGSPAGGLLMVLAGSLILAAGACPVAEHA